MRTYTVHLLARRRGEGRTFCGRKYSTVESLPEGDHLSPNERLCASCCAAAGVDARGNGAGRYEGDKFIPREDVLT